MQHGFVSIFPVKSDAGPVWSDARIHRDENFDTEQVKDYRRLIAI